MLRMFRHRTPAHILLDVVTLAIAAHSIVVGVALLTFPTWVLKVVGWPYAGDIFWPNQAGLFLIILGGGYAASIRFRPLIWLLICSKGSALVFLLAHAIWLDAPRLVILLGLGDGSMGLATALLYARVWIEERRAAAQLP